MITPLHIHVPACNLMNVGYKIGNLQFRNQISIIIAYSRPLTAEMRRLGSIFREKWQIPYKIELKFYAFLAILFIIIFSIPSVFHKFAVYPRLVKVGVFPYERSGERYPEPFLVQNTQTEGSENDRRFPHQSRGCGLLCWTLSLVFPHALFLTCFHLSSTSYANYPGSSSEDSLRWSFLWKYMSPSYFYAW